MKQTILPKYRPPFQLRFSLSNIAPSRTIGAAIELSYALLQRFKQLYYLHTDFIVAAFHCFHFFWCTFYFSLFLSSKYWIQNRCGLLKVEAPQDPPEKTGGPTGASQNEPETPQNVPEMPQNPPEVPSSPVDVSKMDEMIAAANLCGDSKVPISDL